MFSTRSWKTLKIKCYQSEHLALCGKWAGDEFGHLESRYKKILRIPFKAVECSGRRGTGTKQLRFAFGFLLYDILSFTTTPMSRQQRGLPIHQEKNRVQKDANEATRRPRGFQQQVSRSSRAWMVVETHPPFESLVISLPGLPDVGCCATTTTTKRAQREKQESCFRWVSRPAMMKEKSSRSSHTNAKVSGPLTVTGPLTGPAQS